jgi:hypothetical protein
MIFSGDLCSVVILAKAGDLHSIVIPAKAGTPYTLAYRLKRNGAWRWTSAPPGRCGVLDPRFRGDDGCADASALHMRFHARRGHAQLGVIHE